MLRKKEPNQALEDRLKVIQKRQDVLLKSMDSLREQQRNPPPMPPEPESESEPEPETETGLIAPTIKKREKEHSQGMIGAVVHTIARTIPPSPLDVQHPKVQTLERLASTPEIQEKERKEAQKQALLASPTSPTFIAPTTSKKPKGQQAPG
jgi:hypothetical protein